MFHIPNQVTTLYSHRAHDHQLRDENALRLLHSKQIPTSKLDVFLKSALDLASTVVPMDTALLADVLPSLLEEELRDDIQIPELLSVAKPPSNCSASRIIDRTATAAAGQIVYRYADFASNVVLIAQEPVIPEIALFHRNRLNFGGILLSRSVNRILRRCSILYFSCSGLQKKPFAHPRLFLCKKSWQSTQMICRRTFPRFSLPRSRNF